LEYNGDTLPKETLRKGQPPVDKQIWKYINVQRTNEEKMEEVVKQRNVKTNEQPG
jgi:hypothetical protein